MEQSMTLIKCTRSNSRIVWRDNHRHATSCLQQYMTTSVSGIAIYFSYALEGLGFVIVTRRILCPGKRYSKAEPLLQFFCVRRWIHLSLLLISLSFGSLIGKAALRWCSISWVSSIILKPFYRCAFVCKKY